MPQNLVNVISTEVPPLELVRHSGEISNYFYIPRLRPLGLDRNDKKDSLSTPTVVGMKLFIVKRSKTMEYIIQTIENYIKESNVLEALKYYKRVREGLPADLRNKYDERFSEYLNAPEGLLETLEEFHKGNQELILGLLGFLSDKDNFDRFIEKLEKIRK